MLKNLTPETGKSIVGTVIYKVWSVSTG